MMLKRILGFGRRRFLATLAKPEDCHQEHERCLNLEDKCMVHPTCGMPKVVIVGAGYAGLSAAQRLLSCGLTDVTVLEACDRLGGRVMSCWLGDAVVELGLGMIGCASIANPAYNLAVQLLDSDIIPVKAETSFFVTSEGRTIEDFRTEDLLFKHILSEAPTVGKKTSLLHFLDIRLQQELLHYPEHLRYDAERVLYGMANELRFRWGSDLASISASKVGFRRMSPGYPVRIAQGNSSLIVALAKSIPYQNIKTGKEVLKINWVAEPASGPRAIVCTHDGDSYEADYVIVTMPIGVLKNNAADIFSPGLPDSKMTAINSMGIGYLNKIYMEYEEPWWAGDFRLRFAWSPCEITRPGNWTLGVGYIEAVSRTVLCFLLNGPEALMVENSAEEEIAMELTRMLRKRIRDCTIPYPHHIIVTRWGSNRYCRGSVMGMTLNTSVDDLLELGHPVPMEAEDVTPVLLFAGDMTVPKHYSRFPAARISGLREADRILSLTRKFSGPPKPSEQTSASSSA